MGGVTGAVGDGVHNSAACRCVRFDVADAVAALQSDGGVLGDFRQAGGSGYDGGCLVFDQRVALDAALRPVPQAAPA